MDNSSWLPPFDEVAFTEDTLFFSDLVGAEQGLTQRTEAGFDTDPARDDQQVAAAAEPMKMSAVPHQHNLGDINVALVITIMYLIRWQDNMLPARLLQGHKLMAPCSYRCL